MRFGADEAAHDIDPDPWDDSAALSYGEPTTIKRRKRSTGKEQPHQPPPRADTQLKLRPLQQVIRDDSARFKNAVLHRRFGKTMMAVDWLVEVAETCTDDNPRCYFIAPTYKAAKNIAWQFCLDMTRHIPGIKCNEWELSISFPWNSAKLQLLSAVNFQRHRGIYADACVFDETPLLPPSLFSEVFLPALSTPGRTPGRAMFTGTPAGKGWQYRLYNRGLDPEATTWASWLYTIDQTGLYSDAEKLELQQSLTKWEYAQEYLCDFNVAHRGAYFANAMNAMEDDGRLGKVDLVEGLPVTCAWYLAKTDSVVLTMWQNDGDNVRCVDSLWQTQTSIPELCAELDKRPYKIAHHYAPKRAHVDHYASRVSQARGHGLKFKLAPELPLMDSVYACKDLLTRTSIDLERCEDLGEALMQWHAEYDSVRQVYSEKPHDDWTGDFAGSVGTFAAQFNPRKTDWSKPLVYPGRAA